MLTRAMAIASLVAAPLALLPVHDAYADDYPIDEVIVRLKPTGNIANITSAWNATVLDSVAGHRIFLLHLNNPALQDSMAIDLDDDADSRYCDYNANGENAEARRQIVVIAIGDSTDVLDQDAYTRVNADLAHAYTRGAGARVALLDTGFDLAHPFVAGHFDLVAGFDFVDQDADASETLNGLDDDGDTLIDEGAGHGTMVAGIVKSIAPEATLLPIRVLNDEGRGSVFAILQGIYRAYDMGAHVVNVSLGTMGTVEAIGDALEEMELRGVAVIAAAGNDSMSVLQYPARDSKAFAVSSLDSLDVKAGFANYSSDVDVCAPGVGIFGAYRNGGYGQGAGTSFSAPFVSGAIALLRSLFPTFTLTAYKTLIENGAVPIDNLPGNEMYQGNLGAGRLDCYRAILAGFGPTSVAPATERHALRLSLVPNPAHATVRVNFHLALAGRVVADVFTVDGRRVRSIELGRFTAGAQSVPVRADLAPGRYVLALRTTDGPAIVDTVPLTITR